MTTGPDWILYYEDGSTFTSEDGTFEEAPAWGLQVIVCRDEVAGWKLIEGGDYFRRSADGDFVAMKENGLIDYVANVLRQVKVGRMLSSAEFDAIYQRAKQDMKHVRKVGRLPDEVKRE